MQNEYAPPPQLATFSCFDVKVPMLDYISSKEHLKLFYDALCKRSGSKLRRYVKPLTERMQDI